MKIHPIRPTDASAPARPTVLIRPNAPIRTTVPNRPTEPNRPTAPCQPNAGHPRVATQPGAHILLQKSNHLLQPQLRATPRPLLRPVPG